jgi:hypothetical protein
MARVSSGTSPGALPGNPRVYYAYQIVADASTLTLGEEPILHSLGVTWGGKRCQGDCAANRPQPANTLI